MLRTPPARLEPRDYFVLILSRAGHSETLRGEEKRRREVGQYSQGLEGTKGHRVDGSVVEMGRTQIRGKQ